VGVIISVSAFSQTSREAPSPQTNTWTGAHKFTGPVTLSRLNDIFLVDGVTYLSIQDADMACGSHYCEIWYSNSSGMTIPATKLGANHILRFIQGGVYSLTGTLTMSSSSALIGPPTGMGKGQILLREADGANLQSLIHVAGNEVAIRDLIVDGNKENNPSASDGILVDNADHLQLIFTKLQNFKRHGLYVFSNQNNSHSGIILGGSSQLNGGDGVFCERTADWYATNSDFDNNASYGMELSDCPAWRITANDFGGASGSSGGLYLHGTAASSMGSMEEVITANQFGNMAGNGIYIVGHDGVTPVSIGNNIVGNSFIGSGRLGADNTYDHIKMVDGGGNIIVGNMFTSSRRPNRFKYAIEASETTAGRALHNAISDNTFPATWGGSFGTGFVSDRIANDAGMSVDGVSYIRGVAGCTTAASAGATCITKIIWPIAFADANYTPICSGELVSSGVPLNGGITAKTESSVSFQTVAGTAAVARFTAINCTAVRDQL